MGKLKKIKYFYQILNKNKILSQRTTKEAIIKDALKFRKKGRKFTRVIRSNNF